MKKNNQKIKWILVIIIFTIIIGYIINRTTVLDDLGKAIYPFLIGSIFAFILNMLLNIIEKKVFRLKSYNKKARVFSILLSIIIFILIIVLLNSLVIPQLIDAINTMLDKLPNTLENLKDIITNFSNENEEISKSIVEKINENQGTIQEILKKGISSIAGGIKSIFSKVIDIIIAFIFAIYLLASKEKIQRSVKKIVIAYLSKEKQKKAFKYLDICNNSFYNFITGQCKEAIILGILCCIGMLILKIPYALVISVVTIFTALFPLIGAWISGIFGFLLIATVNPIKAIIFVVFIIILQQLENALIYPKVVGKSIKIPSVLTLIAITFGGQLFGVVGIILGVPLVSILYIIFNENTNERLKDRHK